MFHAIVAHFFLEVVQFCRPKRNNPTRADKARVGLGRCGRRGLSPRRESDTAQWERDVPSLWSGGAEEAGHTIGACARDEAGPIRSTPT